MVTEKFSDEEARAILDRQELLNDDATGGDGVEEIAEPEPTSEEILQAELARPCESRNDSVRRKLAERDARWAKQRATRETTLAEAMAALERKLVGRVNGLLNEERGSVLKAVDDATDELSQLSLRGHAQRWKKN